MAKTDNLIDYLTDIADAIREKKGTTDPINAQDFADEIRNVSTEGEGSSVSEEDIIFFSIGTPYHNTLVIYDLNSANLEISSSYTSDVTQWFQVVKESNIVYCTQSIEYITRYFNVLCYNGPLLYDVEVTPDGSAWYPVTFPSTVEDNSFTLKTYRLNECNESDGLWSVIGIKITNKQTKNFVIFMYNND